MLCGLLCSPEGFETGTWLQHLTGYSEGSVTELPTGDPLNELLRNTLKGIDSQEFGFELLLPDDDEPLMVRTDALGGWCRGFLSGFGISRGAAATSAESQEFLGDIYQISRVDPNDNEDEVSESAFQEIVEYARMGAILLREENRQVTADVFDPARLH